MNALADLPAWVQLTVAALVLVGSTFTLVGGIGLLRLPTFYDRAHAPTIGSSGGIACLAAASI